MRLNVQTDYALRVLMHVALKGGELVRMADIANDFGISHNHLTKVVHRLATLGYLTTVRGRSGGMRLAGPVEQISIGEVVRHFEPDFKLVECMDPATSHCRIQPACVLQNVLQNALEYFLQKLDEVNLTKLVQPRSKLLNLLDAPVRQK